MEHKKDIDRLQDKASKYEDEATHGQFSVETLARELKEKVGIVSIELLVNRSLFLL